MPPGPVQSGAMAGPSPTRELASRLSPGSVRRCDWGTKLAEPLTENNHPPETLPQFPRKSTMLLSSFDKPALRKILEFAALAAMVALLDWTSLYLTQHGAHVATL